MNLPSANNRANERREMRSAHKAIAKRRVARLSPEQKMNAAAAELVKNGLVTRIDCGFLVSKSIFGFVKYEVISGKCPCFAFNDNGMCEHALAGRAFADREYAEAEKASSAAAPRYDTKTTKAMIIEREANGKTEVITFSQSCGELSMWLNVAFANNSDMGLSDMLAETFFQGAVIVTAKAKYRLWIKPEQRDEYFFQAGEIDRIYQDVI